MGTLLTEDMRSEVAKNLGGLDSTDARILRFLNLSQTRMARAHDFMELKTVKTDAKTVTGTPTTDKVLTFTENIRDIYSILITWDSRTYKLVGVTRRQWDQIIPASEELSTGRPTHYTFWAKQMELYRVPDKAYTLIRKIGLWPTDLVDGQKSDFDNKDDIIITMATHIGFQSRGQREDAGTFFAIYQDMIRKAIAEDLHRPDSVTLPRRIQEGMPVSSARDDIGNPLVRRTV